MNKNNLNRIKGILSAKQGTLVPKFLKGTKFRGVENGTNVYSNDGLNWYLDENLTNLYKANYSKIIPTPINAGIKANVHSEENAQKGQAFMAGMNAISTIGGVIGAAQQATDSNLTKGISAGYDGVANVVSSLGPYGLVIGGAMKTLGALGDMSQAMGGGTDQMSKLDSWMDSPLLSWNIGMLNGFAGKNSNAFGADQDILAKAGSSYGGTTSTIMDAAESADKKYGLFSWKSRKKANETIAKAQSQQNLMGDIADQASDQKLAVQSMGEQAGIAYSMMTDGGYNQKYTYAAKEGGVLEWTPEIKINWEPKIEINWELPLFKDGGEIEWVPELQKGGDLEWVPKLLEGRTLEELIEYAKKQNPRFVQRLQEDPVGIKFTDDDGNEVEGSHYLEWSTDDLGNAIVYPRIQEMENGELRFLSSKEAYKRAVKNNNILVMTPEEAQTFFEEDPEYLVAYKRGFPDFFNKFKQGGSLKDSNAPEIEETTQKNVIPEGALHKNKHHMEHAEGLTKKGIPVIDEEGEQQAEIEHSEIIFTLEVTKKLEEYYEIFYSEESTNKEKELAALDAGKLLVYQILENTEDRTGLIDSCKKGGILTHKISNDSVKEISEWIPNIVIIEKEFEKNPKNKEKSEKDNIKDMIKEVLIEILTGK